MDTFFIISCVGLLSLHFNYYHLQVCEQHFHESEIFRTASAFDEKSGKIIICNLKTPKLSPDVIPSIFPNCPSYLSQPHSSKRRSRENILQSKEEQNIKKAIEKSKEEFELQEENDRCSSLIEVVEKLKIKPPWHLIQQPNEIQICYLKNSASTGPEVQAAMCLNEDMFLNVFLQSVKLAKLGSFELPLKIDKLSKIHLVCATVCSLKSFATAARAETTFDLTLQLIITLLLALKLDSEKFTSELTFIVEQLQLMRKECHPYSYEYLVFSSLLHNISPSAYRFLRSSGNITLPCLSTIRKVTLQYALNPANEQNDGTFLLYIKQKFKALQSCDKTVSLLVDEIHLSAFYDYKGGSIVGAAHDAINAVTTAFAFMITSTFSEYKDVVHLLPARKMDAQILFGIIKKTVVSLEKIGFKVISIITDNNAINRKAMSSFASPPQLSIAYPHPCNPIRPLFYILDSVHILKCIRNNWLNQKLDGKCFKFPPFKSANISTLQTSDICTASFVSLKELYGMEAEFWSNTLTSFQQKHYSHQI